MTPSPITTTLLVAVVLALLPLASAYDYYRGYVPNGALISNRAFGHYSFGKASSSNTNAFGSDFNGQGAVWTQFLCRRDSDRDGFTNGWELGDPCCVWTRGGAAPFTSYGISNPADPSSVKNEELTPSGS